MMIPAGYWYRGTLNAGINLYGTAGPSCSSSSYTKPGDIYTMPLTPFYPGEATQGVVVDFAGSSQLSDVMTDTSGLNDGLSYQATTADNWIVEAQPVNRQKFSPEPDILKSLWAVVARGTGTFRMRTGSDPTSAWAWYGGSGYDGTTVTDWGDWSDFTVTDTFTEYLLQVPSTMMTADMVNNGSFLMNIEVTSGNVEIDLMEWRAAGVCGYHRPNGGYWSDPFPGGEVRGSTYPNKWWQAGGNNVDVVNPSLDYNVANAAMSHVLNSATPGVGNDNALKDNDSYTNYMSSSDNQYHTGVTHNLSFWSYTNNTTPYQVSSQQLTDFKNARIEGINYTNQTKFYGDPTVNRWFASQKEWSHFTIDAPASAGLNSPALSNVPDQIAITVYAFAGEPTGALNGQACASGFSTGENVADQFFDVNVALTANEITVYVDSADLLPGNSTNFNNYPGFAPMVQQPQSSLWIPTWEYLGG